MVVHSELEARPQQHVRAIDVAVCDGNLTALQLERKMLIQTYTDEDSKTVIGGLDKFFRERLAKGKGRVENRSELTRNLMEGVIREERGQKRVFGRCIVDESEIEVVKRCFYVVT